MNEWMTEEETADWLGLPLREVKEAIRRGELPILRVGNSVRLSRTALVSKAGADASGGRAPHLGLPIDTPVPAPFRDGRVARPVGLEWKNQLTDSAGFEYRWPAKGGTYPEQYPRAWSGTISLAGGDMSVRVGEATGAERNDKVRRLTVWIDNYPMAEFVPTADRQGWASLIKPNGRHTIAPTDPVPPLYRSARVEPYQQATGLRGRGRPSGAAVVVREQDLESAVHHAAARWLGKNGRSAEPAA